MSYSKVKLTSQGQAYLEDRYLSGLPMEFAKIELSSRFYAESDIPGMTSLDSVEQVEAIRTISSGAKPTDVEVEAFFSNANNSAGFTVGSIGIYVLNPQYVAPLPGESPEESPEEPPEESLEESPEELPEEPPLTEPEIPIEPQYLLYGVALAAENPLYIAPPSANQFSLTLRLTITVGEAEVVNVNVSPSGIVTQKEFRALQEQYDALKQDYLAQEEVLNALLGVE